MKSDEYHMNAAIHLEWQKCLRIMLYILYNDVGWNRQGLMDFKEHFWEFLGAEMNQKESADEIREEFREVTRLHLESVKLHGNFISKAMRTTDASCFEIGGVILFHVAEWDKRQARWFIYQCWDYLDGYSFIHGKTLAMLKQMKINLDRRK